MSPGSSLPGRGSQPAPLRAASRILEKDRPKLDEAQRALAPGDYGVHAGAVGVVGADAAVAVAIQGCCIAAIAAITLTGDEIDEGRFLCLLHYSPQCCDATDPLSRPDRKRAVRGRLPPEYTVSIRPSQGVNSSQMWKMPAWGRWAAGFSTGSAPGVAPRPRLGGSVRRGGRGGSGAGIGTARCRGSPRVDVLVDEYV